MAFLRPVEWYNLWGQHLDWLMSKGLCRKDAGSLVGMVLKKVGNDCTKADWTFRRVKDRNPKPGDVVRFLMRDVARHD